MNYGVWTDHIVSFLDDCINNEELYTSDAHLIITTLLENSIRAVKNEDEEDFESYIAFDFEKYFEEHLSLKLKLAGFLDIKFSQTVAPFDADDLEPLLVYRFTIEYGNQKRYIRIESDCDIFILLRSIFNGILLDPKFQGLLISYLLFELIILNVFNIPSYAATSDFRNRTRN